MTSIGEALRRERLRRNLKLEQISEELKISARMLAAIEAEDFEKLPGGVFAKSFVRQYAHVLGLDEEEIASEVDRMLHPEQAVESTRPPEPVAEIPLPRMEAWQSVGDSWNRPSKLSSWLPALLLVVVVMLICSGIYAFLQRPRRVVATTQQAPAVQPRPAEQTASQTAPTPQNAAAPPAAQESTTPQPGETALPTAALPQSGGAPAQAAVAAEKGVSPAPANSSAPQTAGTPPGAVHVELTANEAVWVRVVSDGKYVFSGTLQPNQTRVVDAGQAVDLRLGNAGGVNIVLNGKPLGPVGPKGQVRNVQITTGGFQIVAPKSPVPLDPL